MTTFFFFAAFFVCGVIIGAFCFWFYTIGHCLRNDGLGHDRVLWLFVVICLNIIGSVIYHIFAPRSLPVRRPMIQPAPQDNKKYDW